MAVDIAGLCRRFQREKQRDEMIKLAKKRFRTKSERKQWTYGELDRLYPPLENGKISHSADDGRRELAQHRQRAAGQFCRGGL